jgi:hypothetical protein
VSGQKLKGALLAAMGLSAAIRRWIENVGVKEFAGEGA